MRRVFWFVLGAIAGASAVIWARRKAEAVAERLTPSALFDELRRVVAALVDKARSLLSSVDEG